MMTTVSATKEIEATDETAILVSRSKTFIERVRDFKVETQDDANSASDYLKQIRVFLKNTDEEEKRLNAPFKLGIQQIRDKFKAITAPVEAAKEALDKRVLLWLKARQKAEQDAQDAKRKALEESALKFAAEREKEGNKQMAETALNVAVQAAEASGAPIKASTIKSDMGSSAGIMKTWTYEVVDITKVPHQYLMENSPVINKAIKGEKGIRDIPGLRIFQKESLVGR